jgi:CelD/BcsL family acetyltransferase involved in cellulose biosynthesis
MTTLRVEGRREERLEVITTIDGLNALASVWDGLGTCLDSPIGRFSWTAASVEHLAAGARLSIAVLRRNGDPVAIAPLVIVHGVAQHIGVDAHQEPCDFSYADAESLESLCRELAHAGMSLALPRLPADAPTVAALERAYGTGAQVLVRSRPSCPVIELPGGGGADSVLSSSLRSDLRRAARKAGEFGELSFQMHAPSTKGEVAPLWDVAARVEAAGWKGRRGSALLMNDRIGPFLRDYATRAASAGILRILLLEIGADDAAMMIALQAGGRFWILKIGYDERFADCSPGQLVMQEGLRHATRSGLSSYEFLGTDEPWTRRWTKITRPTVGLYIYPHTIRGRGLLARDGLEFLWRKAALRLKEES